MEISPSLSLLPLPAPFPSYHSPPALSQQHSPPASHKFSILAQVSWHLDLFRLIINMAKVHALHKWTKLTKTPLIFSSFSNMQFIFSKPVGFFVLCCFVVFCKKRFILCKKEIYLFERQQKVYLFERYQKGRDREKRHLPSTSVHSSNGCNSLGWARTKLDPRVLSRYLYHLLPSQGE